ncbi:MAG: hypothetical protein RMN24_11630 [Anaerolineae bacterium]|nr:hypothetical protein [Anaerolineae bacterium]
MPSPSPRLSPLALPSYTTLFFFLIALVILGAALASLLPDSQLAWPLLVIPIPLLTLRDFLQAPERIARRYNLRPADASATAIANLIAELSRRAGIQTPQLLIGPPSTPLFSFGTFRRSFIALGSATAAWLSRQLRSDDPTASRVAHILIAHELAHFANRDIQLAALARSLLKTTALYTLFALWSSLSLVAVLIAIGPEITQDAFWHELGRRIPLPGFDLRPLRDHLASLNPDVWQRLADPTGGGAWGYFLVYLTTVFLPFILAVPILALFFWRKLIRVRELYADAFALTLVGSAEPDRDLEETIALYHTHLRLLPAPAQGPLTRLRLRMAAMFAWPTPSNLLGYAPPPAERLAALADPLRIFGRPWQMALWTGVAVLLLELILRSSLTLPYITQPGPHLPLLTATLVFSLWLLPQVVAGQSLREVLPAIAGLAVLFTILKLAPYGLDGLFLALSASLGRLDTLKAMLDTYLRAQLGIPTAEEPILGGAFDWLQFLEWQILRPAAYYALFGAPLLGGLLGFETALRRLILTWYPLGPRVRRVFGLLLLSLTALIGLVFIPTANRLFFPAFYPSISPAFIAALGCGLMLAVGGVLLLVVLHARLGRRCPACRETVPGPFVPGKRCSHCGEWLHPWLLSVHET